MRGPSPRRQGFVLSLAILGAGTAQLHGTADHGHAHVAGFVFGCVALVLACLLVPRAGHHRRVTSWASRLMLALSLGVMLYAVDLSLLAAELRGVTASGLLRPASWFLNLTGWDVYQADGLLQVQHKDGLVRLRPSFDKTGLRCLLGAAVAGVMLTWTMGRRLFSWRTAVLPLAALVGMVVSFTWSLLFYLNGEHLYVRTEPSPLEVLGSVWQVYAALAFTLVVTLRFGVRRAMGAPAEDAHQLTSRVARMRLAGAAFGASLLCGGGFLVPDPGELKPGRILVDDHSSAYWEPSARLLDRNWYGDYATYSFTAAVEWLSHRWMVDVNPERRLSKALLSNYDILILKTPTEDFSEEEIRDVRAFVEEGGGLLLVGDHTDLLGSSTRFHELIKPWPLRFRDDAVLSGGTGAHSHLTGRTLLRHPAASSVDELDFMTSCSLELGWTAEAVLVAPFQRSDAADYANNSYFGASKEDPSRPSGPLVLAGGVAVGKGRVYAFTDSTIWSSFTLHKNGHVRPLGDAVRWLQRKNWDAAHVRFALGLIGGGLILLTLLWAGWRGMAGPWILGTGWGLGLAMLAAHGVTLWLHQEPEAHVEPPSVRFQWIGCEFAVPPVIGSAFDRLEVAFDTLTLTMLRLGAEPSVALTYAEVLEPRPSALVVVNPLDPPPPGHCEAIAAYVESGGELVLIDALRNGGASSINAYLAPLGASMSWGHEPPHRLEQSGLTRLTAPAAHLLWFERPHGQGRVTVLMDSEAFSREGLGHPFAIPWAKAKSHYETLYRVFGERLRLEREERRTYGVLQ